jgi:hypothetical protein
MNESRLAAGYLSATFFVKPLSVYQQTVRWTAAVGLLQSWRKILIEARIAHLGMHPLRNVVIVAYVPIVAAKQPRPTVGDREDAVFSKREENSVVSQPEANNSSTDAIRKSINIRF